MNRYKPKDFSDIGRWMRFQKDLANPEKLFDEYEQANIILSVDREKTLQKMKELDQKLSLIIPDNHAELVIVDGKIPSGANELTNQILSVISLIPVKAWDRTKIEEAESELIEKLKEVDGPCLSLDAPSLFGQIVNLYQDAPMLIAKYGDILRGPAWQTRLFRLDP